jgi:hypothetical protein
MDAATLLHSLTARGLHVVSSGDDIKVSPSRLLTDADRQAIRAHKPQILALLSENHQRCANNDTGTNQSIHTCSTPLETDSLSKYGGLNKYERNHLELAHTCRGGKGAVDVSTILAHERHACSSNHTQGALSKYEQGAIALLRSLSVRGVTVTAVSGRLQVSPESRLTNGDRAALERYRHPLLVELSNPLADSGLCPECWTRPSLDPPYAWCRECTATAWQAVAGS